MIKHFSNTRMYQYTNKQKCNKIKNGSKTGYYTLVEILILAQIKHYINKNCANRILHMKHSQ